MTNKFKGDSDGDKTINIINTIQWLQDRFTENSSNSVVGNFSVLSRLRFTLQGEYLSLPLPKSTFWNDAYTQPFSLTKQVANIFCWRKICKYHIIHIYIYDLYDLYIIYKHTILCTIFSPWYCWPLQPWTQLGRRQSQHVQRSHIARSQAWEKLEGNWREGCYTPGRGKNHWLQPIILQVLPSLKLT